MPFLILSVESCSTKQQTNKKWILLLALTSKVITVVHKINHIKKITTSNLLPNLPNKKLCLLCEMSNKMLLVVDLDFCLGESIFGAKRRKNFWVLHLLQQISLFLHELLPPLNSLCSPYVELKANACMMSEPSTSSNVYTFIYMAGKTVFLFLQAYSLQRISGSNNIYSLLSHPKRSSNQWSSHIVREIHLD